MQQMFLEYLNALGLVVQTSADEDLAEHLSSTSRTVYCGFDPTADSLHVGNLVPLLALRRFQLAGHRPILLIGGATGLIGDPSGRSAERELRTLSEIEISVRKIKAQATHFLDFDCGQTSALVVNNAEWTKDLTVIDFLRDLGKHFSVNAMINKEFVRSRLGEADSGISYTEFSYILLQSYDFLVLNQRYGCTIQMGGNDQWGNITSGLDLIRRVERKQAFALSYPLLTKADGTKFGKSTGGIPWLDPSKTSPYAFYQFWRNSDDQVVIHFLRLLTFLDSETVAALEVSLEEEPGKRLPQIKLAEELTRTVHGDESVKAAERITGALFDNEVNSLKEGDLDQLALDGMASSKLRSDAVALIDILVESQLAVTPRGEVTFGQAKKLIRNKAVWVNGAKVEDETMVLSRHTALHGRFFIIQKGKKNHHLVVLEGVRKA
ncbi:MAG: tyrosine--tRNA ligase [Candidatus Azotimanducaceae bacterium]|nr:tyrosine--tRNA ligase [Gammaproteobacteria bacterium]OUV68553.1 MAG: tyrosine--tRNA ligase [Gammaproteobacteria bacterium TMED133]